MKTVSLMTAAAALLLSGLANAADVRAAAEGARQAQAGWAATPGPMRADVIRKFASLVEANAADALSFCLR